MSKISILIAIIFTVCTLKSSSANVPMGTFKINLKVQPTTLNPFSSTDLYSSKVQSYIVESLLTQDIDTFEWKPSLAKSWKVSKDKMKFIFTLREGIKWSDGKPITVEDVVFSLNAIKDKKNRWKTAQKKTIL